MIGFTYVGNRFPDEFSDFIAKYRFFDQPVGQAYVDLRHKMENKNYHVITTNADNAFHAAEFDMDKVFRIQGECGLWQCSNHCHQQTYHDESLIRQMVAQQSAMKIPAALAPYCVKCGAVMEVNKRNEEKGMGEDKHFHEQKERYEQFLTENQGKKILFLEIGVGHATPQFIKHPFQQLTEENPKALFVTINQKDYFLPHTIRPQTIQLDEDIAQVLHSITLIE